MRSFKRRNETSSSAMDLDPDVVASLVVAYQPTAYLRVTPIAYRATPLGMGFGKTRFASSADAFKLLYIAEDLATSLAEAVIRDRFEGATARELRTYPGRAWRHVMTPQARWSRAR